jgi:hypothetical protein
MDLKVQAEFDDDLVALGRAIEAARLMPPGFERCAAWKTVRVLRADFFRKVEAAEGVGYV